MAKFKCPYTFPHKSRVDMVDYIVNIGRYRPYPISFNVKAHSCDLTFDNLWEKYALGELSEYFEFDFKKMRSNPARLAEFKEFCEERHKGHEGALWEWGQKDAWRSVDDCATYRMLWDADKSTDMTFGLHGRSGGHLVIEKWNGWDLRGVDLAELLMERDNYGGYDVSFDTVKLLYKFCRHWEYDFTQDKASRAIEHGAAWSLFVNIVNAEWVEPEVIDFSKRRINIRRDERSTV